MPRYSITDAQAHIRLHHPGCPDFAVDFFAKEISRKKWKGAKLGMAVGITMQSYLRHNLTEYDQLLLEGVERAEAKRRVQPKINRMIASWGPAIALSDSG